MAICNRDLDVSQQKVDVSVPVGAIATSTTKLIHLVPAPCTLVAPILASAAGVSNAMQVAFQVKRFVAGAGETAIAVGISNLVLVNSATSGPQGFTGLAAVGSTLLSLQVGDAVQIVTSVANGNATDLALSLVFQKTQDIVSHNAL